MMFSSPQVRNGKTGLAYESGDGGEMIWIWAWRFWRWQNENWLVAAGVGSVLWCACGFFVSLFFLIPK